MEDQDENADILNVNSVEETGKITHELLERIKELNCLHNISHDIEKFKTLEDLLPKITLHISQSMQFPQISRTAITLDGKTYGTESTYLTGNNSISSDIKTKGEIRGSINVYYTEDKHFSGEEIKLLQSVSERIGKTIERIELDRSFKLQKDRLDLLFASMNEGVIVMEEDYLISFMNRAAIDMFGDQTGSLCYQTLMGENEPCQICPIEEIINKGQSNFRHTTQLKGERWVELTASPVKNIDESLSIIEIVRDITEVKTLETELKQAEERYRSLLENANDAIVSTRIGGKITFLNKKAEEVFGYIQDEIIGKSILDLMPERLRETHEENIQRRMEIKSSKTTRLLFEGIGLRKDGTELPVEVSYIPLGIGEHSLTAIFRDITDRKKAEEDKSRSDIRLQQKVAELSIMNEISEVLLSTRELDEILHMILIGVTAYQALGFNRAFLFLINEEATMLKGEVATGSLTPEEAYKIWERLAQEKHTLKELLESRHGELSKEDEPINNLVKQMEILLTGTENIFTQTLYENKSFNIADGKNNPLIDEDFIRLLGTDSFALVPLIYRGIPLGVLLADNFINKKPVHDEDVERLITFANHASLAIENSHLYKSLEGKVEELSNAYNELQENRDKLIRYERLSAVGEVAAKVTHEIRNPMVVIGGFARRILRKDHDGELNRNYVKIIVEEISRMENILTDILYFAKPAVPKCDTVDINRIVRNSIEVLSFETEENNIGVEEHLDPNLPMLFIDENQVRRVLINLIRNAIQAMPDGGTITISTTNEEDQWVIIETADTGVGISDDDMDKLFDAFFSSKSTGSGLGLTVSAQIINNHGGTIEVQKREPKGTIFKIKLPVKALPEQSIFSNSKSSGQSDAEST